MTTYEKMELVHRCQQLLEQRGVLSYSQNVLVFTIPPDAFAHYTISDNMMALILAPENRDRSKPTPFVFRKTTAGELWSDEEAGMRILHRLRKMMLLDDLASV